MLIFWLVFGVFTIFAWSSLQTGKMYFVSFALIGTLVFLWWIGYLSNILTLVGFTTLLTYIAAYFIVGTAWAAIQWKLFVMAARRWFNDHESEVRNGGHLNSKYFSVTRMDKNMKLTDIAPKVSSHKSDILTWIALWPWSMTWTILNDPVVRFVNAIYRGIASWLQKMSYSSFSD